MPSIAEQVFYRLKSGELPEEVRKSVTSVSKFSQGLQTYTQWALPEAQRVQTEILSLQRSVQTLENTQKDLSGKIESLNASAYCSISNFGSWEIQNPKGDIGLGYSSITIFLNSISFLVKGINFF